MAEFCVSVVYFKFLVKFHSIKKIGNINFIYDKAKLKKFRKSKENLAKNAFLIKSAL